MAEKEAVEAALKSGEILPSQAITIDMMAKSCMDVFFAENSANITDELRAVVLDHYVSGVRTLLGVSETEAAKVAKRVLVDLIAAQPVNKTIFATEPAVTTAELQAVQTDATQQSELIAA